MTDATFFRVDGAVYSVEHTKYGWQWFETGEVGSRHFLRRDEAIEDLMQFIATMARDEGLDVGSARQRELLRG